MIFHRFLLGVVGVGAGIGAGIGADGVIAGASLIGLLACDITIAVAGRAAVVSLGILVNDVMLLTYCTTVQAKHGFDKKKSKQLEARIVRR